MKNIYGVTVLLNGIVYGTWTLDNRLTLMERDQLRALLVKASNKEAKITVQFSDNLECDNFSELMSGIKESLYNDDYLESKE